MFEYPIRLMFGVIFVVALVNAQELGTQDDKERNKVEMLEKTIVTKLPPKDKFHLYLLMGQSNMAGRAKIGKEDAISDPRILSLNQERQWVLATDPLHWDRATAGVGPGMAFARTMIKENNDVTIGLIPCARGATALMEWEKGSRWGLFEEAVGRAKEAMKYGTIKGVLWAQGETDAGEDSNEASAKTYAARLAKMVKNLRTDLDANDLPFVAAKLAEVFKHNKKIFPFFDIVDQEIDLLPGLIKYTSVVDVNDLTTFDGLHYNSVSARELGERFAKQMIKMEK